MTAMFTCTKFEVVQIFFTVRQSGIRNFRFDQFGQLFQRLLPTQVTPIRGDQLRNTLLRDIDFGTGRHLSYPNRRNYFPGHIGIVEAVRVLQEFIGFQFQVLPAERMAVAGGKILKRHFMRPADLCVHFMYGAQKTIGRQPGCNGQRICEGAINFFGRRFQHPVQRNIVVRHNGIF